ncbi:MAG: hypothetical protein ACK40G_12585 [Cytophagaceae bacterium]
MKNSLIIIALIVVPISHSIASGYNADPGKDSLLNVLMVKIKAEYPDLLIKAEEADYQSYSYIGHIINEDSVVIYRIMSIQAKLKNSSSPIKKLLVFSPEKYLGCYDIDASQIMPQRILNHKYLIFDYKVEGQPKKTKINFQLALPEHFKVEEHEYYFNIYLPK